MRMFPFHGGGGKALLLSRKGEIAMQLCSDVCRAARARACCLVGCGTIMHFHAKDPVYKMWHCGRHLPVKGSQQVVVDGELPGHLVLPELLTTPLFDKTCFWGWLS